MSKSKVFVGSKRYFAYLLSFVMVAVILFPFGVFADGEPEEEGDISFGVSALQDVTGTTFTLSDVTVDAKGDGVTSLNIIYPANLALVIPAGYTAATSIWEVNQSSGTVSFIIKNTVVQSVNQRNANTKTLLESLSFTLPGGSTLADDSEIKVSVDSTKTTSYVDETGGEHFYEFVSAPKLGWIDAYNAARARTWGDTEVHGYLATVTSQEEQDKIYNSIAKEPGWLGGTRLVYNDADGTKFDGKSDITAATTNDVTKAKEWYWADGPEAGTVFFNRATYNNNGATDEEKGKVDGVYNFFENPMTPKHGNYYEPNNQSGEHCLAFAYRGAFWNDLNAATAYCYYVEYSGIPKEVVESQTNVHAAPVPQPITVNYLSVGGTPVATSVTAIGAVGNSFTSAALDANDVPPLYKSAPAAYKIGTGDAVYYTEDVACSFSGKAQTITYLYDNIHVNFDLNYDGHPANPKTVEIELGQQYVSTISGSEAWPNDPARTGWDFLGWNTLASGEGDEISGAAIASNREDQTLYAVWQTQSYTLSFNKGAEEATGEMEAQSIQYGVPSQTISNEFKLIGHHFSGWVLTKGTGTLVDGTFTLTAENETREAELTAEWEIDTFTVTFYDQDQSVLKTAEDVMYGGSTTPPETPEHEGYTFVGWDGIYQNVTRSSDVYAVYRENEPEIIQYTVLFIDKIDNNLIGLEVVNEGDSAKAPVPAAHAGYEFTGWDKPFNNVSSDLTVYALYKAIEPAITAPVHHTVIFADRDGKILKSQNVLHGGGAKAPAAPKHKGYTFTGWDKEYSDVRKDITVTAQFSKDAAPKPPVTPGPNRTVPAQAATNVVAPAGAGAPEPEAMPEPEIVPPPAAQPEDKPPVVVTPTQIKEDIVPLDGGEKGTWSLLSLMLSLVSLIISASMIAMLIANRKKGRELYTDNAEATSTGKANPYGLLTIVIGILTVVCWLLLDNLSLTMALVNKWTIYVGIVFILQVIMFIVSRSRGRQIAVGNYS